MKRHFHSPVLMAFAALGSVCAFADSRVLNTSGQPGGLPPGVLPAQLEGVGVEEHLGRQIDLNLTFIAENGYPVALKDFFNKGKPVILDLVYYRCPMLCSLVLNGQVDVMRELPWTPGNEYEVVTISIDPQESFDLAREKRTYYSGAYERAMPGWHFLTDHDGNAKRLAETVGFHYRYDQTIEQYAHPAAFMILTPQGKLARYLYGIKFRSRDVRFALAEAAENRTTMAVEKILLFCYHYDPRTNSYTMFATNLMRLGGLVTVFLLGYFMLRMIRAERAAGARHKEGLA